MATGWDGHPKFSEFSYGFALTHELVGWTAIGAAPVFPSLLEEGKPGGGWDVKLDRPGLPLYLQFKRSQCIISGNGRERRAVKQHIGNVHFNDDLALPYYRFFLMESSLSQQHDLLLELDQGPSDVFYAAPYFHEQHEFDTAWTEREVTRKTAFIRPAEIGSLPDGKHSIAFDKAHIDRAWVCSKPKEVPCVRSDTLLSDLTDKIKRHRTSVKEDAVGWIDELQTRFRQGVERHEHRVKDFLRREALKAEQESIERLGSRARVPDIFSSQREIAFQQPPSADRGYITPRLVPPLEIERSSISDLSDIVEASEIASRFFGLQLFVVQERE
jgi:hypothetical protein